MDTSDRREEIYIPKDAQVGCIPLWTIPDRLLDRMGVPRPSNDAAASSSSCAPTPSPEGTWISPVLVRKRSHPAVVSGGDTDPAAAAAGGVPFRAMRRTQAAAAHGSPVEIPFVTSNRFALEVLRDFLPGARLISNPTRAGPPARRRLPRVTAPPLHQDAVIVYQGNVFLSIRRPKRRRGGEDEPPVVAPPSPAPQAPSPVVSVPDSSPAASTGERPPRHPGGLQNPEDPSAAPHPVTEDSSSPHPATEDPSAAPHSVTEDPAAAPHPVTEDPAAAPHPVTEDPSPPHSVTEDPSPPHPATEDLSAPHPVTEDPSPPHPVTEDSSPPHPVTEEPSPPHPATEDPSPPHPATEEESGGVRSETSGPPTAAHPAATSSSDPALLFGDQQRLSVYVPPHQGRLRAAQQNYRHCDFEALAMDEKIAQMKVKLRESEEALRRGCS